MQIRGARPEEWPQLKAFRLRALEADPDAFGSTLAREVGFADDEWRARIANRVYVAERDAAWVGTCSLLGGEQPEIVGLWVAPEARGLGVGAALLRAATQGALEWGSARVSLWASVANGDALRLYAREGFARTGQEVLSDDGRRFVELDRATAS